MIIWLAMLIPFLTVAVLLIKFHHKTLWWEFLLLLIAPLIFISASKAVIEHALTSATEFWGSFVLKTEYYEDWNERVSCRHPRYRTETSTDSKGHTTTR